jgi:hypothetical protein
MELDQKIKNEIIEITKMSFETGHFGFEEMELAYLLVSTYSDKSNEELKPLLKMCLDYYNELVNLGPVGFYEEFKDVCDFDPMFVEEYGHYYDDEEEED